MFPKFSTLAVCLFLFTDWPFSDKRYLNAKLVNFSDIIAMVQLENLGAECCVRGGWLILPMTGDYG